MVTTVGYTVGIPDSVMGLTFVAFGSSVPDGLASMIVAKQGKGYKHLVRFFVNKFVCLLCYVSCMLHAARSLFASCFLVSDHR